MDNLKRIFKVIIWGGGHGLWQVIQHFCTSLDIIDINPCSMWMRHLYVVSNRLALIAHTVKSQEHSLNRLPFGFLIGWKAGQWLICFLTLTHQDASFTLPYGTAG